MAVIEFAVQFLAGVALGWLAADLFMFVIRKLWGK